MSELLIQRNELLEHLESENWIFSNIFFSSQSCRLNKKNFFFNLSKKSHK